MRTLKYADTGTSPASVNRTTGDILINHNFDAIEKDLQDYILLHENGHFVEQTRSELQADAYASSNFFNSRPGSLKKSLKALSQFLDVNGNNAHNKRYYEQLKRALAYDYITNNNEKAIEGLNELRKKETYNFNQDENNINMTGSGGFVWGFFSTVVLIIAIIAIYIYLKKQTGGIL